MFGLMQQAQSLESLPDEALIQLINSPDPSVEKFIVASEMQRRADLRRRGAMSGAKMPTSTVVQDSAKGLGYATGGRVQTDNKNTSSKTNTGASGSWAEKPSSVGTRIPQYGRATGAKTLAPDEQIIHEKKDKDGKVVQFTTMKPNGDTTIHDASSPAGRAVYEQYKKALDKNLTDTERGTATDSVNAIRSQMPPTIGGLPPKPIAPKNPEIVIDKPKKGAKKAAAPTEEKPEYDLVLNKEPPVVGKEIDYEPRMQVAPQQYADENSIEAQQKRLFDTNNPFPGVQERIAALRAQNETDLSGDKNLALLRAGLGMMGTTSSNFLTSVGQGGLAGADALSAANQAYRGRQAQLLGTEAGLAGDISQRGLGAMTAASGAGQVGNQGKVAQQGLSVINANLLDDSTILKNQDHQYIEHADVDKLNKQELMKDENKYTTLLQKNDLQNRRDIANINGGYGIKIAGINSAARSEGPGNVVGLRAAAKELETLREQYIMMPKKTNDDLRQRALVAGRMDELREMLSINGQSRGGLRLDWNDQ